MTLRADGAVLLDASVLVELVIAGSHVGAADRLLEHLADNPGVEAVTAAHGLIEAVSALRRLNLSGQLSDDDAVVACQRLKRLDLRLDPTAARIDQAWRFRHTMTAYDAAYAAAAHGLGLTLISADRPLVKACGTASVDAIHLEDAAFLACRPSSAGGPPRRAWSSW